MNTTQKIFSWVALFILLGILLNSPLIADGKAKPRKQGVEQKHKSKDTLCDGRESDKQESSLTADAIDSLENARKGLIIAVAAVADNIANAETAGFKKSRVVMADKAYRQETTPGKQDPAGQFAPTGVQIGSGSQVAAIQLDFRQGTIVETGRELDVAIEGPGFLQVQNPRDSATLYTRSGKLAKNPNGQLVICSAATGRLLEPPIQIPQDATSVAISAEGQVSVAQPGNNQLQVVGQIQLATFVNPEGLVKLGENLYQESDASGPPCISNPGQNGVGALRQGSIESSNVDLDEELKELKRLRRLLRTIESLLDE
jgi:flagellar basal-body rod protein FlgG